jgi:hypothetical protein
MKSMRFFAVFLSAKYELIHVFAFVYALRVCAYRRAHMHPYAHAKIMYIQDTYAHASTPRQQNQEKMLGHSQRVGAPRRRAK